ncbi:Citrate transporter [Anatilimnocola aggregata]|uniref:Citrate transporter n=1 Tax=Anatilimnocola aggregata TaxID=2528021 RepID=A0A517YNG6_9BACT|nr:SLC13 family permease [Anatilimnocola aggregata]QDU31765.1 Citrate transporter [Anatilimnocola aggregata]
MSVALGLVLGLLVAAVVMFAINRPRMDAVALIVLTLLPFVGVVTGEKVVTMNEALAGFADANIVLIAALFVIGDGLVRTGVARLLGDWLTARAAGSETNLLVLLMVVVCGLGATMSSTAVTAIFIPVVLRISRSTGTSPSRLMMPLSMAALISGMMTLVATAPNLVVNAELQRTGTSGFQFFSFAPFGVPVLIMGIVYMLFARHWLSAGDPNSTTNKQRVTLADWILMYKLEGREYRAGVKRDSILIGKSIEEIRLNYQPDAQLVAIERERSLIQPTPQTRLQAGDILFLNRFAETAPLETLLDRFGLQLMSLSGAYFSDVTQDIGMAEVIVPALSELVGKSAIGIELREKYGLSLIGLRRGKEAVERGLSEEKLQVGDTLLLIGPWQRIETLRSQSKNLVVLNLPAELDDVLPVPGKALLALGCLGLVVGLMVSGLVPNVQAALIGCLLMGGLGIVNLTSAYKSIDWKTIVLIVGMLPFSTALQRTGGVDLAADGLMTITEGAGIYVILGALFAITAILGLFISNTATAVLMAPVAIAVASDLGFSPYPFAMIVALAASTAFMTPVSSPVNTLVVTPGNYSFGDFIKVGVPFSILVMIVCVFMVPWLLPLK